MTFYETCCVEVNDQEPSLQTSLMTDGSQRAVIHLALKKAPDSAGE